MAQCVSLDFSQWVKQKGGKKEFALTEWLTNKMSLIPLHLLKQGIYCDLDPNTVILGTELLCLPFF